ncbi:MAG: PEP/pyruvate-binding domain-containing protein [Candidatus Paceibacterota bacterium]
MLTKSFVEISKDDVDIAGGKGASLGEMTQAGIPVPAGFVVLSGAFERFLEETDLNVEIDSILHSVDQNEMHTVENASEKIQSLIKSADMPEDIAKEADSAFKELGAEYVAVRSSATAEDSASAAWAGQLDSYLNTTEDDLLDKVKNCWASLFTPRAIFYRIEKNLHNTKVSVAVVVQKMVEAEKSGIAFSVHPVTEDHNQLIIETGFGLGEAIVSGQITPDSYVVEKDPRRIIDINVNTQSKALYRRQRGKNEWKELSEEEGSKQVLSEDDVLELSELILKIEDHYDFPCDIEWAYDNGEFYIVQSRPITTLKKNPTTVSIDEYHDINPDNYERMFAGESFAYIFSDIFLDFYKSLDVLSVQNKGYWMSFIPRKIKKITLKEGEKLYTLKKLFDDYEKSFSDYIKSSQNFFASALEKKKLEKEDVAKFFKLASQHFSFYSKTEFFYTNLIDEDKMIISVDEFDKLKLDGRSHLNKLLFEGDGFVQSLLKKISKQTEVAKEKLHNYSTNEIVDLIANPDNKVDDDELKDRETFFASKDKVLFGSNAEKLVNKLISSYQDKSNVIKGTSANGGFVRAKARVLKPNFSDFDKIADEVSKMKEGEILVAETTAPEVMPACKKASAIITNQGGMLSHAAIVSRELGIPCVIGTDKDLILNIKTGDEIEVDADEGVIRVLNKK